MCYKDQIQYHIEGTGYWHPRNHQHPSYDPVIPPLTLDIPEASGSGQLSRSFSQDPDLSPFVTPRHHLSNSESEDSNEPEQSTRTPLVLQAPVLTAHREEEEEPLTPGEQVYLQILQQAANTPEPEALQLIEEAIEAVVAEEPELHIPVPAPVPVHQQVAQLPPPVPGLPFNPPIILPAQLIPALLQNIMAVPAQVQTGKFRGETPDIF